MIADLRVLTVLGLLKHSNSREAEPSGKHGRRQTYREAAIQSCLTLKVVFGMALRQTTGFVASVLKPTVLDGSVPDFSTLCLLWFYKGPLQLLIDSTGIKVSGGEGEWLRRKHGCQKRCQWHKLHLAIDEATLEIRAVEVTGAGVGDAPILPELLEQRPPEQEIASVTADGAYDIRKCFETIAERGAFAVIPPRKNAALWKPKTKMHCLKQLGTGVMARALDSQVTELHIWAVVLNRYTALGILHTVSSA